MDELELKFCIPPLRLKEVRAAVKAAAGAGSRRQRLMAHYFDTPDRALARHHVALRLRKEGRRWVQTLKAQVDGNAVLRLEHNVDVRGDASGSVPLLDIERHQGTPAYDRLMAALAASAGVPVSVRYSTNILRQSFEQSGVEIALDEGQITAGATTFAVSEVEFELKCDEPSALFDVAQAWAAKHGLWLSTVSKAARGDRLADAPTRSLAVKGSAPMLSKRQSGGEVQRAVLSACVEQVLGNASEIAAGELDEELVHQLRVGIRRLRSALHALGKLGPGVKAAWEPPLVAGFRTLGAYRDAGAVLKAVAVRLEAAGAPMVMVPTNMPGQGPTVTSPHEAVLLPEFQAALLSLLRCALLSEAEPVPLVAAAKVKPILRRRLAKLRGDVLTDGARFEQLETALQHRVRKRVKRLRYVAELVGHLFGGRRVARYLGRLSKVQTALGKHNDIVVALGHYRAAAANDPRAWFAVGWLESQQSVSAKACAKGLKALSKAEPFWK